MSLNTFGPGLDAELAYRRETLARDIAAAHAGHDTDRGAQRRRWSLRRRSAGTATTPRLRPL